MKFDVNELVCCVMDACCCCGHAFSWSHSYQVGM